MAEHARPTRLISATRGDLVQMGPRDLKAAIGASEGRVVMAQSLLFAEGLSLYVTNPELESAFGADMILLNGYSTLPGARIPGLRRSMMRPGEQLTLHELKALVPQPVGVYFEAVTGDPDDRPVSFAGRQATPENVGAALEQGADFVVLGGNPASGVLLEHVIASTRLIRAELGDDPLLMAGKWEDGSLEPVLADPRGARPSVDVVRDLVDAGADVITLPAPGSRQGITTDMVRACVEAAHAHRPGTLALTFLNGSVEGADPATIRAIGLLMKETGADIHAIGDGGMAGCPQPENLFQLCLTIKGAGHTYHRMAGNQR